MIEELGKAAEGLGAHPFLVQPSKPAAVLRRVFPALRMLHLFKVILCFLHVVLMHLPQREKKKK